MFIGGVVSNDALVDTGANINLLSGPYYRKLLKLGRGVKKCKITERKLRCANSLPIPVIAEIEVDVKLGGIVWPGKFTVVENLVHEVIIGMAFLKSTEAVIDTKAGTLSLFNGLTSLPMSTAGEKLIVKTVNACEIPAFSEAIISVNCSQEISQAEYIIENDIVRSPCKKLLVARSLVNVSQENLPCRVMNVTEKPIKLKAGMPVGVLSAVEIMKAESVDENKTVSSQKEISMEEKITALTANSISLKNSVLKSTDFEELVNLLYRNIDLFANSLQEIPGCDLIKHRIDTSGSPPIAKRSYRLSPADQKEADRQVDEMLASGILELSNSPFNAPLMMIRKRPDAQTGREVPPR